MPRKLRPLIGLLASLVLAWPATAQEIGIHWQQDIETAKAMARQSGRLVLVHVWANGCGPCLALDQQVFNQPSVAGAVEAKFVPVKLNADENPGTAQFYGITRVPTDLILTPDGQLIGKLISPATPMAYVAEVTQLANQYASQSGQTYQMAAASASQPMLNSAYANLPIGPPATNLSPPAPANGMFSPPVASAPPMNVTNSYMPAGAPSFAPPQTAPPVAAIPVANPYAAYAPPMQPQPPFEPQPQIPAAAPQIGYDAAPATPPSYAIPPDTSVPPSNPNGPVSSEATRPEFNAPSQFGASGPAPAQDARQLPPGAPPLGFDGYCPVSMRTQWKWVPGDPKVGAIHRGRSYWFAGPREQQEFLARPDYYSPVLAGIDPVLAIDHQQSVPGLREHSLDYDNQFYLFSSEATLQQFTSSPERYASGVRQAMGMPQGQQVR